jgi:Glycosyl transferases group 1
MRVLIVGPTAGFKRVDNAWLSRRSGLMFYCFANRLANGFVRNGQFVMMMNDRDDRKRVLNSRLAGGWLANQRLLRMAKELHPDLLVLHHCDLITAEAVQGVKEIVPHCRVAVVYYDNLFREKSAARFRRFLDMADFGFATTGGPTLAQFADECPVAFIPNPVDLSIDNLTAFAVEDKPVDVFCAACPTGRADRWGMIDELCRLQPKLRYALHGRAKTGRISGNAYYLAVNDAKAGLNLNREEGDLYASDRMAQYLGNGLLLATARASGYGRYFGDDEMIFFDGAAELADKLVWAVADDRRWRVMAEKARAKAAATMAGDLVCDFIARMTMGEAIPNGWQFTDHIFGAGAPLRQAASEMARSLQSSQKGRVAAA